MCCLLSSLQRASRGLGVCECCIFLWHLMQIISFVYTRLNSNRGMLLDIQELQLSPLIN